ncbi:MAG TPA: HPr kinase/phosphatase C-terminal domain-containing protein [Alphaproteobacteria bacterium]|nr:HPr kinase/phosphatase C-terminal domain-containing protein [Alphaproteobacteria bacterium]
MADPRATATSHGTCIAIDGAGVLIRGSPGAGKSDLALRLIDDGAKLVADDQVRLHIRDGALIAQPPDELRGMMEVNGIGIMRVDPANLADEAALALVVDLVAGGEVERLPEAEAESVMGIELPRIRLSPFEASAPAKLRLAAGRGTGFIMPPP